MHVYLPFMILAIWASLEAIDPALLQAAMDLGARPVQVFRKIVLPLSLPGIVAGSLFVFVPVTGEYFGVNMMGGTTGFTITNAINDQFTSAMNWPLGSAMSFVLLCSVGLVVLTFLAIVRNLSVTRYRLGFRGDVMRARLEWPFNLLVGAVLAFLYAPIVVLVIFAFNESAISYSWSGFTLKWFEELASERIFLNWRNTLVVSVGVVTASTVIGTMAAYTLVKYSFRGKLVVIALLFVPIIIPRSIVGISMLLTLSYLGIPRSLLTIALGQVFYVLPFVVIAIVSVIIVFDRRLEEAALDLGASPWTTFRRVTFPLILNGIATGAAVAFILSFSEFTLSYYLAGGGQTLPIYIFSEFKFLITPKINALSTSIVALVIVVTLLTDYIRRHATFRRRG